MSIWDDIGDFGGRIWHDVTGTPSDAQIRDQQNAMNEQIQAYKDQTAIEQKALEDAQQQEETEKRQINEKQIRALRNNYRPAGGFLNNQNTLGNSTALPSKLGS